MTALWDMVVDGARFDGARFLTGGRAPTSIEPGPFLPPTIIEGVEPDARIITEEVFGPVMVVQRYKDLEHAIALANDGNYGLTAGVFTADLDAAMKARRRLQAGLVWVNTWNSRVPELLTGGMKASGMGRELGMEGMLANLETKTVPIDPAGER